MFTENHEMPIGWPLGLGNMNMRLGVVENSQASAAEDSYSAHMPSTSFSSFSSSNLDTEDFLYMSRFIFPYRSGSILKLL
ncbi:uncharacterized protein LOC132316141 isoform X2 [Cornus florida]|uniref:uncharacterized protein LOC132316141 isoform X2 n=1 Tax=Cornus florida TaxID=4283 RepID=UPI00289D876A|nr:uncharacterized protein LOC132316141 isoform X2 [Cornus florida]